MGDRGPELWDRHGISSRVVVWGWGDREATFDSSRVVVVVACGECEGIVTPSRVLWHGGSMPSQVVVVMGGA